MAIANDISVAVNGDIRYTGALHAAAGAGYYTVIEFHRFLQDLADDGVASNVSLDFLDITGETPSDRSTDNIITINSPYNIDQTLAEHLYDGTISQGGGADVWDGLVIIANEGMDLQIQQNGAIDANDFWNSIINAADIDTSKGQTVGAKGLNRDPSNGISHRFMMKVVTTSADIDGRRLLGQTRVTGFTYSEFKVNGTANGNNVMALTYAADLNDTTDASTRTQITNTEGYAAIDIDVNGTPENYYSEWDADGSGGGQSYSINQFYERMKYVSRQASVETLYGLTGEVFRGITHQVALTDLTTGIWVQSTALTWGTGLTAGTGQLLAIDSTASGTATLMWLQILTGVAPNANTITNGTATATVGIVTERVISTPFCGGSTGSALIGSYGFGIQAADTKSTDKFFDLTNTAITPPNNVTFNVEGLVSAEDRILVGPENLGGLELGQFVTNAILVGGETSIVVTTGTELCGTGELMETDTPATGTLRIQDNNGIYQRIAYTAVVFGAATATFTVVSAPAAAAANEVFISYIDKEAAGAIEGFTVVYAGSPRALFIRVRDGGIGKGDTPIKTFETTGSLGSGGGSTNAIRTSDL